MALKKNNTVFIEDGAKSQPTKTVLTNKDKAAQNGPTNAILTNEQKATMTNYTNANAASSAATTKINGVDQATLDKMNNPFSQSQAVTDAQNEAGAYRDKLKEITSVTDIVDQATWDTINSKFQAPSKYDEAMNYTNGLLAQLSTGRTSYTDQIKDLMGQIQNRDPFEYDVDSDMLFQQYLASSMASGKTAMQDTMGQAAALTGGYGSTYATSASNQAYNAYIQDAYNNLPEYYSMALEAYQMEGEEMYNQLAMLNEADAKEYGRLYDAWSANYTNAQDMYKNAYTEWNDTVNNAVNSANLQLNEHGQLVDDAYKAYTVVQDHANTLYQNEYNQWADQVDQAATYAKMANSDYWSTQNFIEGQRQFNESLTQKDAQFREEMEYKRDAMEQDNSQFYAKMVADAAEAEKKADADYSTLSNSDITKLEEIYLKAGGGEGGHNAVEEHLELIGKNNLDDEGWTILEDRLNQLDLKNQNWQISDDTKNGWWIFGKGDDHNDMYKYGDQEKSFDELKEMAENSNMTEAELKAFLEMLRKQSTR